MSVAVFSHASAEQHLVSMYNPEIPARYQRLCQMLGRDEFVDLRHVTSPKAEKSAILRAHDLDYLEMLQRQVPASGVVRLADDVDLSSGSWEAILRAAGAPIAAIDGLIAGEFAAAFCLHRPPGHHAERNRAMGFCFLNNTAIGTLHALATHNLQRVAIVDFDVHHGNGTQNILWNEERIFYVSSHQMPLYPGSGSSDEQGAYNNILNVPLASRSGSKEFRDSYEQLILPKIHNYRPQLLIISAGFDAHRDDPLANLNLSSADYAWITERLCEIAHSSGTKGIVSLLEGGYSLPALSESVGAHLRTLMQHYRDRK